MEMSTSAVMTAIDHMLGGPGGPQPERPLTEVEMPLLRGLLERMLGELRYGFESLVDISPKLRDIEYNAQFLRAHQPGDAVVIASFDMKIGTEECVASICLPFNTILPVLEKQETIELTPAERMVRDSAQRRLTAGLSAAPIDVAVRFQPIRMRTDDIVDLRPGDVVPLGHPTSPPPGGAVQHHPAGAGEAGDDRADTGRADGAGQRSAAAHGGTFRGADRRSCPIPAHSYAYG